jgi:hypothetical protein
MDFQALEFFLSIDMLWTSSLQQQLLTREVGVKAAVGRKASQPSRRHMAVQCPHLQAA